MVTLTADAPPRRRTRRDPEPHFQPDVTRQLNALQGCPELQVPAEHLAREVRRIVEALDTSTLEAQYSSLGRRGYHPRYSLGVWIYGSLLGIHESTKLGAALKTDAALRLLSGGHIISEGTLRRFRSTNRGFFEEAIEQTVRLAHEQGLVRPEEIGVDSVRLRAHAATSEVRTLVRSRKRLAALLAVELDRLSDTERERHEQKVAKHRSAIERCEAEGRTNFVVTNSSAGLLKFPDGGSAPGHRVTVAAVGVKERLIVSVLIDADGFDFGKSGPALRKVREVFERLGIFADRRLQAALDAGYWCETDLQFAADSREWIDVLIAERNDDEPNFFGHDKFTFREDGSVLCPADRLMKGPRKSGRPGQELYEGIGCASCELRPKCTSKPVRTLVIRRSFEEFRRLMRERMAQPDAKARYNQRIATIEPVFSNIESTMKYRRATTRHDSGILGEILLKLLAHNVSRLIAAKRLCRVSVSLEPF